MRLTCPNCKAQYEVADGVIPPGGRDVQCSACGSTWFQYPAEVALRMRAAELEDDDDDDDGPAAPAPAPVPAEKRVDKTVLDVLRQEAERELAERRQARPDVATQPDLGLVGRPRRKTADAADPLGVSPSPAIAERSRRSLLPDIEAISPVIESANAERAVTPSEAPPAPPAAAGRDFRRGLSYAVVAIGALVGLYLLAPTLSSLVPALEGPLAGYVTLVDQLRAAVLQALGG
jgi:predicted Zn finger-like uncharacterized protein